MWDRSNRIRDRFNRIKDRWIKLVFEIGEMEFNLGGIHFKIGRTCSLNSRVHETNSTSSMSRSLGMRRHFTIYSIFILLKVWNFDIMKPISWYQKIEISIQQNQSHFYKKKWILYIKIILLISWFKRNLFFLSSNWLFWKLCLGVKKKSNFWYQRENSFWKNRVLYETNVLYQLRKYLHFRHILHCIFMNDN